MPGVTNEPTIVVDGFNTGLVSRGRDDARQYRQVFDWFEGRAETDIDPILARYEAALHREPAHAVAKRAEPRPPDCD